MNDKFKENILNIGLIICSIFILYFILGYLFSGIQLFVQFADINSREVTTNGVFIFVLMGLLLVELVLILIRCFSHKARNNLRFNIILFFVGLLIAITNLIFFIYSLTIMQNLSLSRLTGNGGSISAIQELLSSLVSSYSVELLPLYIESLILMIILTCIIGFLTFSHKDKNICIVQNNSNFNKEQNLENNEIEKIKSDAKLKNKNINKLLVVIISICSLLVVVSSVLFAVFISTSDYKAERNNVALISQYYDDYLNQGYLTMCNYNDYDVTLSLKITYTINDEYAELLIDEVTLPKNTNAYNIEFVIPSSSNDDRIQYFDTYYLNENNIYLRVPYRETYSYKFGAKEIIFLVLLCLSGVGLLASIVIYIIKYRKNEGEATIKADVLIKENE